MSIQEARRAAFEQACQRDYPGCFMGRIDSGRYINYTIESAWWAWNAALDSVVVKLPSVSSARNNEVIKAVGRYIWAQGIRVEVKS